ncbi:unnamed protein product [Auanema sp. JU1783]|nr:unnamed protein product [Auanema sp. JU1783]
MSTFDLQLEDYVKSVADSILTILTISKDDSVRKAAWDITGVKNNSELATRVQHDLQNFFEYANKKKHESTFPIDSQTPLTNPVRHREDDCFSECTSEEDMFSESSCFSSDECPSTESPRCFSSSDGVISHKEDDMFSSDGSEEFLGQGDAATKAIPNTIPIDDIDYINPFVNALKVTCTEEVNEREEDEECWSQEDMLSHREEISCFSSSSKEYMDLRMEDEPTVPSTEPNGNGRVLAIAGCTNAGKTTIANLLIDIFVEEGATVELVHQDDYYLEKEKVEKVPRKAGDSSIFFFNYDCATSVDQDKCVAAINEARQRSDYVIVEGNMITEIKDVLDLCDRIVFLTLDQKTCRRRRTTRHYDPPDDEGYFDEVVWPAYQRHLQKALALAREDRRFSFLDVSSDSDQPDTEIMMSLIHSFSDDFIRICFEPIDINEAVKLINSPSCGATSVFVGTTRDTFNGRIVVRLDYESYDEMAYKELRKLCAAVREKYPSVERVVIFHRIGEVAVGETSLVIATASPHRKDAIHATEMAIDELKRTVPIWKKEVYEDGGCSWKENGEWSGGDRRQPCTSTEEKSFAQANRNRDANRKVFWLRQMVRQMKTS